MKKRGKKLSLKRETLTGLERIVGGVYTDACSTQCPTRTTDTDPWTEPGSNMGSCASCVSCTNPT